MKIATFNINSIRARLPNLIQWLQHTAPDVVLLQECKCQDDQFPYFDLQAAGYHVAVHGQKAYNGVAILSKHPISDVKMGLPEWDMCPPDPQARYIEATINNIRFCGLYLPNGNPTGTEKFAYKISWMKRLQRHMTETLCIADMPVVLGGDWNVIPTDMDCQNPADWIGDAATDTMVRNIFQSYQNLGFYEVFKTLHPDSLHAFTFWDYQQGAWQKDNGIRIDFFLVSGTIMDKVISCTVDKTPRKHQKASDHTPLVMVLNM